MQNTEIKSMISFYAISPIHAGSGASTAVVDLPIQRERHTNWPHIQASAVKGALRAHYRKFAGDDNLKFINLIFGSDKDNDSGHDHADDDTQGAIAVSDAKLLAFPVRSNVAPFVWVTSPAVIKRFIMDQSLLGSNNITWNEPTFAHEDDAFVFSGAISGQVILEDAVVNAKSFDGNPLEKFSQLERLLLVSDVMYDYIISSCTEVQTQIKIEADKGTTKDGSLRYQELLPADSLLYSIVYFSQKNLNHLQADTIKRHIKTAISAFLQIGGDETLGRGLCKIDWK